MLIVFGLGCTDASVVEKHSDAVVLPPEMITILSGQQLDDVAPIQARLDLSLGSFGSQPEFGLVMGAAIDGAENIYVLDNSAGVIRRFNKQGALEKTFGKRGYGPGEFERPRGLAVGNDTVYVLDTALRAFDTSGRVLPTKGRSGLFEFGNSPHYSAGRLIVRRTRFGKQLRKLRHDTIAFIRYDPFRNSIETVLEFENIQHSFGGPYEFIAPLSIEVAVAFLPDGKFLNSVGDSFHIEVRSKEGVVERSIVSRIPRVRTTKTDFNAFADKWERFHELYTPDHVPNVHRIMRKGPLAKNRPAIGALLASTDGEVLVKRPDLSQAPYSDYEPGATSMWLLLDSKLTPEAHFILPTGFIPTAFRACHIWGTRVMADGVTQVLRYRLERSQSGSCGD